MKFDLGHSVVGFTLQDVISGNCTVCKEGSMTESAN